MHLLSRAMLVLFAALCVLLILVFRHLFLIAETGFLVGLVALFPVVFLLPGVTNAASRSWGGLVAWSIAAFTVYHWVSAAYILWRI